MNPILTFALLGGLLAGPPPSVAEDAADLVLRRGRFYPVSTQEPINGSLAIRAGRISYLGPDEGLEGQIGPGTKVVDLAGRAVTPGWIDAHSHLSDLGGALEQVDLIGTTSYQQVIGRIAEAARQLPPGTWIRGRGWDQNDWQVQRLPTNIDLDAAVPNHPVWVTRIDGHAALLNGKALELLGAEEGIEDPPGGRFLRTEEGSLTGVLIDAAMSIASGLPEAAPEDIERWILKGAEHCLVRGLTTVTEMGVDAETHAAYQRLRDGNRLPIRAAIFLSDQDELLEEWFARGPALDAEARLQTRGIKMYGDGALGSRGAALLEPYSDDPGNLGLLQTSSDHVVTVCEQALEKGFQIGIHAIGDRGALMALDGFERCFERARPEARFRIEHAQVMRVSDIERMAGLGLIASVQPTHATSDMPWAEDRVGAHRIQGAYAWRKALEAGALLALGSDFPVERAAPLLGFYAAITRQDLSGSPAGGWRPEERLTREEALRGFTLDAAYSLFLEGELGSLEVGKRADLVVFAGDPMVVPANQLSELEIDLTLVDGDIVYEREAR